MRIYDDLTSIYQDIFIKEFHVGDRVQIRENNGTPGVSGVTIEVKSDITSIDHSFLNRSTSVYYKNNTCKPEVQHDCDGILLVNYNNEDFLIVMELKTSYSYTNIKKAEKQLTASLFRVLCRLNPLNSFDIHQYKMCGIIVSLPVPSEIKRDIRKKKNAKIALKRFELQADHFLKKSVPYNLEDCHIKMCNLPVKSLFIKNPLPLFHIDVGFGITAIDIYNCLRKL